MTFYLFIVLFSTKRITTRLFKFLKLALIWLQICIYFSYYEYRNSRNFLSQIPVTTNINNHRPRISSSTNLLRVGAWIISSDVKRKLLLKFKLNFLLEPLASFGSSHGLFIEFYGKLACSTHALMFILILVLMSIFLKWLFWRKQERSDSKKFLSDKKADSSSQNQVV